MIQGSDAMSGLIIEGICASGKSLIFKGLTNSPEYLKKQSKIQLSEYLTERIIENVKPPTHHRVNLLSGYVDLIENIHTNFYSSRFQNTQSSSVKPCYILERFHLTHAVEAMDFESFKAMDQRLRAMDFKLLVLKMEDGVIKERLEDTFSRRPNTWKSYVLSFGGLEGAFIKYQAMQNRLLDYASKSSLRVEIIDTTSQSWEHYIEQSKRIWDI